MRRIYWIIYGIGLLALAAGPFHFERQRARVLARLSDTDSGVFAPAAVYSSTDMAAVPPGIDTFGSWLGSDEPQGQHETGWFTPAPKFTILVAGYPTLEGNRLEVEVRRKNGTQIVIPYTDNNPGERWMAWIVETPANAEAIRLRGIDRSSAPQGWLGFSAPHIIRPLWLGQVWPFIQILSTTCLAITLLYGPGLLWFHSHRRAMNALAFAVVPGPLLLSGLGLFCWLLGSWIATGVLARTGVIVLYAVIGWRLYKLREHIDAASEIRAVVAATALLVGFAVAKANISFGPKGELFGGTISRSLAVGGHSDSRISYHVVQLVANHFAPFGSEADSYFSPWSFASRGPLAGLAASPIVLATGANVPVHHPDHTWRPFDREGFVAYRITLIALASLVGWAVFGVMATLASASWGVIAAVTVMLAPFFVHEMYFTWPKLITAGFVLVAFQLAHLQRSFAAGVVLALGYCFHPLALLSTPFLGVWVLARSCAQPWPRRLVASVWFAAGVLLVVGMWQFVGAFRPGEGGGQAGFLQYFRLADNAPATPQTWWLSRWHNFANTFLPGYMLAGNLDHESLNAYFDGPSDTWVRASFLYWNTLPFALGWPAFVWVAIGLAIVIRHRALIALTTFLVPTLFVIVYWGAASTGLMRHCGHVIFVSAIVLGVWGLAESRGNWRERAIAAFLHPACFAWRAGEIALVAFGTTLLNGRLDPDLPFGWNDIFSFAVALGCLAAATILLGRAARNARSSFTSAANGVRP